MCSFAVTVLACCLHMVLLVKHAQTAVQEARLILKQNQLLQQLAVAVKLLCVKVVVGELFSSFLAPSPAGHVIPGLIHKCYLAKQANAPFTIMGSGKPL